MSCNTTISINNNLTSCKTAVTIRSTDNESSCWVDENLSISLSIDVNKIPKSDLGAPFDSVEKLGKARAQLFIVKVQAEIAKKLAEIRALYSESFEGETEVIL